MLSFSHLSITILRISIPSISPFIPIPEISSTFSIFTFLKTSITSKKLLHLNEIPFRDGKPIPPKYSCIRARNNKKYYSDTSTENIIIDKKIVMIVIAIAKYITMGV
jgi:hypothetical protein